MSLIGKEGVSRFAVNLVLSLVLIAAGIAGTVWMFRNRKPPQKRAVVFPGVRVKVLAAKPAGVRARILAHGRIQPVRRSAVSAEVRGVATWTHPRLRTGEFFEKGTPLVRLERFDYENALVQAQSNLARARLEAVQVEQKREAALEEWAAMTRGVQENDQEPSLLLAFEPQLQNARDAVRAAESAVALAEKNLARTEIRAPFGARVIAESVEKGQSILAGNPLLTLYGSREAEVAVALSSDDLKWVRFPDEGASVEGSGATVRCRCGPDGKSWDARVVRVEGEVDSKTKMTRVVLAVRDLYGKNPGASALPPFGAFVEVDIRGRVMETVFAIPLDALREGNTVWTAGGDSRLHVLPVEVVRREDRTVYVRGKIREGDSIVVSPVPGAGEGLKIREAVFEGDASPA
jgi:RND family efflux transporter MFP subunit